MAIRAPDGANNDNKLTLKNLPCLGNAYEIYTKTALACIPLHAKCNKYILPLGYQDLTFSQLPQWYHLNGHRNHQKRAKKSNIKYRKIVAALFDYKHRFEYRWKANVDIANKLSLPKANCVNLCTLNSLQIWGLADIEMQIKPNTGRNIKPNKQTQPT